MAAQNQMLAGLAGLLGEDNEKNSHGNEVLARNFLLPLGL